ncbi:phytoene desaturase family protein [Nocardioides sp. LHG3406-4]|uniref:phytoene desaturase family protein n=1 Tax=Nocardioides sp. LHG3406-4 TaxID=2804575 RepID=UPI003CEC8BFF
MRVVVIGGGFGGLATAARLAKTGHRVTLLERSTGLGGALATRSRDGFAWDAGPTTTLLPAVVRDLFRKTGRPLEREVDLEPVDPLREHRFADGSTLALPGGSRAGQVAAFEALGPGLGRSWTAYVDPLADDWELLRRDYLERPWDPTFAPRELTARLTGREVLHRRLRKAFSDERLRQVAALPFTADGHDLRNVPAWAGVVSYLEQRFGSWRVPGGMAGLGLALVRRLETRGVEVLTSTPALDVVVRDGRAVAVATPSGRIDADAVVCAIDPRRLPALATYVRATMPAIPPVVAHVGLEGGVPDLAGEVVLHPGDPVKEPLLIVRPGGTAPEGAHAWTVLGRGRLSEDVLVALARRGLDVRQRLVTRLDLSPRDLVDEWGGSPLGVLWQGRSTVTRRLGPTTPVPGVYAAGAHATPGSGLPYVGLSAALVAQAIGPAG